MGNRKVVVLNPTSKGRVAEVATKKGPIHLEGKVMGIVWNGKPGGDALLDRLGELLTERFHLSQILRLHAQADVSSHLPEAEKNKLAETCSFVLFGVGD
jgi:hypothetical protein